MQRKFENIDTKNEPEMVQVEAPDEPAEKFSKRRWVIMMTNVNVSMYALCFWIQMGVLPYLTKKLGVDAKTFGYLQTTFSVLQLCGGPVYGRFGDLVGARYALVLAFSASATAYGLLAIAQTIPLLFLSRAPSVLMASMQGSQMVITDVTTETDRASSIGRLGIAYGVGMVIGPFIGGLITEHFSEPAAAATACFGSVISIMIVLWTIPYNTKELGGNKPSNEQKSASSESVFDPKKIMSILRIKNVGYLLAIKCVSGIPIGILTAMFSMIMMDFFHLDAKQNGYILSFAGAVSMLVQGFGIGILTKRFSDAVLIKYAIVTIASSYLLLMFSGSIFGFLFALVPMISGGAVMQVIVTSVITKTVPQKDTGAALGLSMATHSLIRSLAPTIGGVLYSWYGLTVFGIIGLTMNGLLSLYLFLYGKQDLT